MKYKPKKIFIIENGEYVEITYQTFMERYKSDILNRDRHFIPIQKMRLEVSKEEYQDYYREMERNRYLKRLDTKHRLFFISDLDDDDGAGTDLIPDSTEIVDDIVEQRLMISKLKDCLFQLTHDEYELIELHYFKNMSQKDIGKLYHISQQAVSKRIKRILDKLTPVSKKLKEK